MTDKPIERVATIFLAAFYPHLTSRMEGPFNAANSTQRRIAKDAAQAALAALKPGDELGEGRFVAFHETYYSAECRAAEEMRERCIEIVKFEMLAGGIKDRTLERLRALSVEPDHD